MKILINRRYGGFGFSKSFSEHMKTLNYSSSVNWRDNQDVIEEAIKFGLDKASGMHAELKIEEIPDGAYYRIGEYDGIEWIEQIWIEVTLDDLKNGLSKEQLNMVLQCCDIKLK
jgi:hypothetical protein